MLARMFGRRQEREFAEAAEETTTDPAIMAAAGSVLLSWYQFFVRGNRQMGLFVGLWAPTILAFANYMEQSRMGRHVERALGGGSLQRTIEQVVGNR